MRFFTLTTLIALATALPTASITDAAANNDKGLLTRRIVDGIHSLVGAAPRAAAPLDVAPAAGAQLDARDTVYSNSFSWPSSSVIDGNRAFSWAATKGTGSTYTFTLWNTQAANTDTQYTLTVTTTTGVSMSVSAVSNSKGSFDLAESGTGFTVVITG